MNGFKKFRLLASEADREALADILSRLKEKGLRAAEAEGAPKKSELVLAVLSENFYKDEALCDRLLGLIGAGVENVLPLKIDGTPVPDTLKNALYARNIIPAEDRDPELIAERIAAALPKKENRLPLLLGIGGAVLLVIAGIVLAKMLQKPPEKPEPSSSVPVVDLPSFANITQEDLEKVRCVVIVGEHFRWYSNDERFGNPGRNNWPDMLYELARFEQDREEDFDPHDFQWFWNEDGSRATMTAYDLSFLQYLPNLEELHMALADITQMPDLTGLRKLKVVWAYECRMDDLEWLAGTSIEQANIRCDYDPMPLAKCENLRYVVLDIYQDRYADLSAFSPRALQEFDLVCWNKGSADLSGLKACSDLRSVRLSGVPVEDLSFLEGLEKLDSLQLNLKDLKDISAVRQMKLLRLLDLSDPKSLRDFSPISGCTGLKTVRIDDDRGNLRDVSFLGDLPNIEQISLQFNSLNDLDFLQRIGLRNAILELELFGHVDDFSGLSAVKSYKSLVLDPRDAEPDDILPYLEDASVTTLQLAGFRDVDLSALPRITSTLRLKRCGIEDLSSMPENWLAMTIELEDCPALRSLEGLQNQSSLGKKGTGTVFVRNCPLLFDWSALAGMDLHALMIENCLSLPDFSDLKMTKLRIANVPDVTDFSFLDAVDASSSHNFELVGLEAGNLAPLRRFSGQYLTVSSPLEDQAKELVQAGNFNEYHVENGEGGWEPDLSAFTLNSPEELEELPKALLKRITRLCIAGDRLYNPDKFGIREDWDRKDRNGAPALFLEDWETGEESPVEGGFLTDLSPLEALTGLQELKLYAQPLESLDGIQSFASLEYFTAFNCPSLKDASALFAVPGLKGITLRYAPVDSIRGIQNLTELERLDISHTKVSDLSPLAECSFEAAYEKGGFILEINDLPLSKGGLDAIGSIRLYRNIAFNDQDPAVWIPLLKDSDIIQIGAGGDLRSNEDLAAFAADHPELVHIYIGYAPRITDLTPLLALEDLEHVTISGEMKKAIASLDGHDYAFELEIQG